MLHSGSLLVFQNEQECSPQIEQLSCLNAQAFQRTNCKLGDISCKNLSASSQVEVNFVQKDNTFAPVRCLCVALLELCEHSKLFKYPERPRSDLRKKASFFCSRQHLVSWRREGTPFPICLCFHMLQKNNSCCSSNERCGVLFATGCPK